MGEFISRGQREGGQTLWKVALLALNMRSFSLGGSPGRTRFLSWADALGALRYESYPLMMLPNWAAGVDWELFPFGLGGGWKRASER